MKVYKVSIIVLLVFGILFGVATGIFYAAKDLSENPGERQNTIHTEEQRVFDYANLLTQEEEQKLEALIKDKQKEICADIVLVTLDDLSFQSESSIKYYAESFYDDNDFGWNKEKGDGVIFADNWAEGAGAKYCQLVTTGALMDEISTGRAQDIVDKVCDEVNDDPYEAYAIYVNEVARAMKPSGFNYLIPFIMAVIITLIFMIYQFIYNKGRDTTSRSTYLDQDGVHVLNVEDIFLHSHVSKVKIKKENHSSGGGSSSHGGAGGSH